MTRKRLVVAGMGDTGLLVATHLSRDFDVVGLSSKPALVSGQELGTRLTRPDEWARNYRISFDRFRRLDGVRVVQATLTGLDLTSRTVLATGPDGAELSETYDVLVISTGVTNGFWRRPVLQTADDIDADLRTAHDRIRSAASVIVIGGGAAAVNAACNVAVTWPDKQVDLYFPGDGALPQHHPRVWDQVSSRMASLGVGLHPRHRAVVPDDFDLDRITSEPVEWCTGQRASSAEAVLWAIGRVRPNTGWLPSSVLDGDGFVRVSAELRVSGQPDVFAVGDVAATDPLRTSARNRADKLVARNIRAHVAGRSLRAYRPPRRRWGSVLGVQPDGYQIFTPSGRAFRFPPWAVDSILWPWLVRRGIYRGVRAR